MIVVRVELWSAVDGSKTELARMHISNIGGTQALGEYDARTFRGRCSAALDRLMPQRLARLRDYPRERLHVWNLVAYALKSMGYSFEPQPVLPLDERASAEA